MVYVVEDIFGTAINLANLNRETIRRFTLANDTNMTVQVITLGATIASISVPDAGGCAQDVVLGYDDIEGYTSTSNPYFGATVGRVCNRIANGRFALAGKEVKLSRNLNNKHHLHGGLVGFDKAHWEVVGVHADGVSMQHRSPNGHEGYPGEVTATVTFTLTEDNCLHVRMEAETTQTTAVNMTNHTYFNLAGHATGRDGLFEHSIMIKADKITETNADSIPTGKFTAVEGTAYDLRTLGNLGKHMQKVRPADGYDDNFCVELQNNAITTIAKATHSCGRWLEIASNQPGVQFYTGNNMPDFAQGDMPLEGKLGALYMKHSGFCLETQKYPDGVNHANFPSIILNPNEKYNHEVIYKFGVNRSE